MARLAFKLRRQNVEDTYGLLEAFARRSPLVKDMRTRNQAVGARQTGYWRHLKRHFRDDAESTYNKV